MLQFSKLKDATLSPEFRLRLRMKNLSHIQTLSFLCVFIAMGLGVVDYMRYQNGEMESHPIYKLLFINHILMLLILLPYFIIRSKKQQISRGNYPHAKRIVIFSVAVITLISLPMTILSIMDRGSLMMYAIFILVINFIIQIPHKDRIFLNLFSFSVIAGTCIYLSYDTPPILITRLLEIIGLSLPAFFIATSRYNNQIKQFENEYEIAQQKEEADKLLRNILPDEIAAELKANGKVEPKRYAHAGILFTDIVNFSHLSEQRSPEQVALELDKCFRAFDKIVRTYNLEKIKTIGDAYMCVSGVPTAQTDFAERIINAAKAMQEWSQTEAENGNLFGHIRIGIHTGPVVAGVVGEDKFAYDIWGKAVNIAARIESASESGKINISSDLFKLVKDKYSCTYRGEIKVKNMGEFGMYFVE
jgi:class 3 adenylate cyclase